MCSLQNLNTEYYTRTLVLQLTGIHRHIRLLHRIEMCRLSVDSAHSSRHMPRTESCAYYHHSRHNNNCVPRLTGWLNGPERWMKPLIYLQVWTWVCTCARELLYTSVCVPGGLRWTRSRGTPPCLCTCSGLLSVRSDQNVKKDRNLVRISLLFLARLHRHLFQWAAVHLSHHHLDNI